MSTIEKITLYPLLIPYKQTAAHAGSEVTDLDTVV
ncbi:unnamed protein product, partial [marine sediment metagenome]